DLLFHLLGAAVRAAGLDLGGRPGGPQVHVLLEQVVDAVLSGLDALGHVQGGVAGPVDLLGAGLEGGGGVFFVSASLRCVWVVVVVATLLSLEVLLEIIGPFFLGLGCLLLGLEFALQVGDFLVHLVVELGQFDLVGIALGSDDVVALLPLLGGVFPVRLRDVE